ncbi:hypothetical protein T492DRAFT_237371 [Pavlovales sp. CCMP2436]|nr:hypothetical protein T492DRAFT_237371 [Pavlovales sp. CCMP2436]
MASSSPCRHLSVSPPPPPFPPSSLAYRICSTTVGVFYDWAALPQPTLLLRLGVVYAFAAALGGWIATQTYEFPEEALQVVLAANMGGAFSLLVFFLRIYSGWSYVSDRLGMEVLDYEVRFE